MKLSEKYLEQKKLKGYSAHGNYPEVDVIMVEHAIKYGKLCSIEGKIEYIEEQIEGLKNFIHPHYLVEDLKHAIIIGFEKDKSELEQSLINLYNE